jgi:hypothetical protein
VWRSLALLKVMSVLGIIFEEMIGRPMRHATGEITAPAIPEAPPTESPSDRWLYRHEMVDCGKGGSGRCRKCANGPGHGPYWYRYRWYDGKMHKRYVGKNLPASQDRATPTTQSAHDG